MYPSTSPTIAVVRMSCPAVGSKSTVPVYSPARKCAPSVPISATASSETCVASGVVPKYVGRHAPPAAKLVSQSGLATAQLAYPAAHIALAQELALLHVNTVLAIVQALSPHR